MECRSFLGALRAGVPVGGPLKDWGGAMGSVGLKQQRSQRPACSRSIALRARLALTFWCRNVRTENAFTPRHGSAHPQIALPWKCGSPGAHDSGAPLLEIYRILSNSPVSTISKVLLSTGVTT